MKQHKTKICFVASHFSQGGAERQITELIKILIVKKFNVSLLLYQSDLIFYKELYDLDVNLILNKNTPSKFKIIKWINNLVFLKKNLKNSCYDVLHTYLFFNGLIIRLFYYKKFKGKILYSIRNSYEDTSKLFYYLDKILNHRSINVYNSKKSLSQIFPNSTDKIQENNIVIYNGYDFSRFDIPKENRSQTITIGMVGRMTDQKNQIQGLKAFSKIISSFNYNLRLVIIGENHLDQFLILKNFIKNNNLKDTVELLEPQKNIEIYYSEFDIFLLTSHYEGCPNVLFEAMISRCLSLVSSGSNSDLFVKDGYNGLVYDGSDYMLENKLVEAIKLVINNKMSLILENAYHYALGNFSMELMGDQYLKLYNKIFNENITN